MRLIDADGLLANWKDRFYEATEDSYTADDIEESIRNYPTVNMTKPGYWTIGSGSLKCSRCGAVIRGVGRGIYYPTCRNCGAVMAGHAYKEHALIQDDD